MVGMDSVSMLIDNSSELLGSVVGVRVDIESGLDNLVSGGGGLLVDVLVGLLGSVVGVLHDLFTYQEPPETDKSFCIQIC